MLLLLCPRLGGGGARLSETPLPERGAGRDCAMIWMFDGSRVIYFG